MKARAYSKDQERQDALLGNFVSFQKERVVTFAKEESPRLTLVPYAPTGLGNFKMAGPFPVSSPVTCTRSRKGGRVWTTTQHSTNPWGTPTRDGDLSAQSACPGGTGCTACHLGRLQAREKRRPRRSSAETQKHEWTQTSLTFCRGPYCRSLLVTCFRKRALWGYQCYLQ